MAHALRRQRRAHPDPRARRLRAAGRRELESGSRLEAPALSDRPSAGSTSAAASSVRTRTTASAATRSSGAACCTGCGARTFRRSSTWTASRRRGRSTTTRSRRTTSAPSVCITCTASTASIRPSRRAGRFRTPPIPHARGDGARSSRSCARRGCIRRRCRSAIARTAACCATRATRSRASCTRRAKPTCAACVRRSQRPNVTLWTNACARRLITDAAGATGRGGRGRARTARRIRVEAPLFVVSCGAVNSAALLLRSAQRQAPERARELVGARRPALHGAPGDDDAGVSSRSGRTPRCFRRRWRSTTSTCADPTRRIRSGRFSRRAARTASWRRRWCRRSRCGAYEWWVARGVDWLAMSEDLPSDDNRVTVDADGRIRLLYRPNNLKAHRTLVKETKRHPAPARVLDRRDAFARQQEHDAPVRHARASAPIRARRCSIRSAARTTSTTSSSSTRRSSPRRPRSIPG